MGRQIAAEDAGLEAELLGVNRLGIKFGERMGVRRQVQVVTVGSAMDYSFCAWLCVVVRLPRVWRIEGSTQRPIAAFRPSSGDAEELG